MVYTVIMGSLLSGCLVTLRVCLDCDSLVKCTPLQSSFNKICSEAIMIIKHNYQDGMDIFWCFQMVYSLVSCNAW